MAGSRSRPWQPLSFISILFLYCLLFFHPVVGYAHNHRHLHQLHHHAPRAQTSAVLPQAAAAVKPAAGQDDYTCGPDKPCSNKACCGEDGWCGYSPKYCGKGCQSHCDAKAECGQYAKTPGQKCPLNVCCSQHGFCGTTSDFCDKGCQSNCETPKPNVAPSNPQKVVIGYWEAWNMDKPCGTMGPGEIPVELLTHLFVSFGYINSAFEVTNMDGIASHIYKDIGNVKARNPSLKIVIALGGWAFSDPGPWKEVFPKMVSTKANRATFINNLLGFLSQYGYDGVDWEYPGADDRGGTDDDGKNYVALLKELREAINAKGRKYIVTFTAPSSYWYLRHFDLNAMQSYVNWINLMSYDLHGIWDGDNPIGHQVLSHTNLTEIDSALNLFWRVGVEPSKVVLGLGFYGRSFELESASCWKPGCRFKGPGSPGRCSKTAGILSYAEIMEIVDKTGGTPYFDEAAAARYMVYDGNSWISFDDPETFQMKIDYASKMGLHGLMIWAVDLDSPDLQALKSISNGELIGRTQTPFSMVDLERIFPKHMLPPKDAKTNYALINFGRNANAGAIDPNETGFGFMLVTGDSSAVASLKKRDDEPDPLVFLDCPSDVLEQPQNQTQTARVVCLSEDVEGCFRLMDRGVEGTIVEMPDNCAPNTLARAISLQESHDQSIPSSKHTRRAATSKVFDFTFDRNLNHARSDSGNTKVRIDYSNVGGYWDAAVDSPGIDYDDKALTHRIEKRFFAERNAEWRTMSSSVKTREYKGDIPVDEDVDEPLFWDTAEDCEFNGKDYEIGFGAHVGGKVRAFLKYGFTIVASITNAFDVEEANGWIEVEGEADLEFSVGGVGQVDLKRAGKGNPAMTENKPTKDGGHTLNPGGSTWITFQPYHKFDYKLASFNRTDGTDSEYGPYFDGKLATRVTSDFGDFKVNFPPSEADKRGDRNGKRQSNSVSQGKNNTIYSSGGKGGRHLFEASQRFGLSVKLGIFTDRRHVEMDVADISVQYNTFNQWTFYPSPSGTPETCVDNWSGTFAQQWYKQDKDSTLGWKKFEDLPYIVEDSRDVGHGGTCYPAKPSMGENLAWGYASDSNIHPNTYLDASAAKDLQDSKEVFSCTSCVTCGKKKNETDICCGCVNMDLKYGLSDIPLCQEQDCFPGTGGPWPGDVSLGFVEKRVNGKATLLPKVIKIYDEDFKVLSKFRYPAFPQEASFGWEGIEGGKWDSISRYWGNTSLDCSDWSVDALQPADKAWVVDTSGNLAQVRAAYQTEHVFEGQLIGMFFEQWLGKGNITNQYPKPDDPMPKVYSSFFDDWIGKGDNSFPWKLPYKKRGSKKGEPFNFVEVLLSELGNIQHLDRLAILKTRPNGMKGSMFSGHQSSNIGKYAAMPQEDKLMATKEMGMVFEYMNHPDIWKKFCDTYEALWEQMGNFDTFYATQSSAPTIPSLQDEWKEFIEVVLTSLVHNTRTTFQIQWILALGGIMPFNPTDPYKIHWLKNISVNQKKIRIAGTCPHLGSIKSL
ncbi:Killer toxin subunits alpha/beta [Fusarium oxysporum f. sp. rapae]|uniref:Killer toxin subunits alpha/beta n=2 Tax=Fusarium oxysporum TaxID=5507 RepID=A0A8J5P5I0_FUSOX|nr:Killer toxin subunits alpha/beta [Fusarium oxysporum f. sp. rapae]